MSHLVRREDEFLIYQTDDGGTRVEVRFDGETAWLSLGQMAELFQRDKSVDLAAREERLRRGRAGPGRQLLQNLQQLPPTARPTRSSTTTST